MYLNTLTVTNVRNLEDQAVLFDPFLNLISGANGAGKTALLEAISLLARGRSFRTTRTDSVIRRGADSATVHGLVTGKSGQKHRLGLAKTASGKMQIVLDGDARQKISALAYQLPIHVLLPDASDLVLGPPSGRRAFIDWGLFHVEQDFLEVSRSYQRVLSQRNAWLKLQTSRKGGAIDSDVDPWRQQLLSYGTRLDELRLKYVERIGPFFAAALEALDANAVIDLGYSSDGCRPGSSLSEELARAWSRDLKFGTTHKGPHRADVSLLIEGRNAQTELSRGQVKLAVIALTIAQAEVLRVERGQLGVFLIDDLGAELDQKNLERLVDKLEELRCQVIATSTSDSLFNRAPGSRSIHSKLFHVEQGKVISAPESENN